VRVDPVTVILSDGAPSVIVSPVEADGPRVLDHIRELFADAWRNLNSGPERFVTMTVEEQAGRLVQRDASPDSFYLMALRDEQVIGTISISRHDGDLTTHCGELGMGVRPSFRRLGVGRALLLRAIEVARDNGMWNLRLEVRTYNAAAIALYEQCGFERTGYLKQTARVGESYADEYIYQRISPHG